MKGLVEQTQRRINIKGLLLQYKSNEISTQKHRDERVKALTLQVLLKRINKEKSIITYKKKAL